MKVGLGDPGFDLGTTAPPPTPHKPTDGAVWVLKASGPVTIASLFGLAKTRLPPGTPGPPIDPAEMPAPRREQREDARASSAEHRSETTRKRRKRPPTCGARPTHTPTRTTPIWHAREACRQWGFARIGDAPGGSRPWRGQAPDRLAVHPAGRTKRFITGTRKAGSWCLSAGRNSPADWRRHPDSRGLGHRRQPAAPPRATRYSSPLTAATCPPSPGTSASNSPAARLLFCADDDAHGKGLHHAQQAARQTNGMAIIPQWGGIDMSHERLTNFNDLHRTADWTRAPPDRQRPENFTTEPAGR